MPAASAAPTPAPAAGRLPRALGVTAVEFLPLQETQNDRNDVVAEHRGDNYWGYSTLAYFAPDRRYAGDRSPGGPTRELRAMVRAFHDDGIKVYVDVVYNHTAEGGAAPRHRCCRCAASTTPATTSSTPAPLHEYTGVGADVDRQPHRASI